MKIINTTSTNYINQNQAQINVSNSFVNNIIGNNREDKTLIATRPIKEVRGLADHAFTVLAHKDPSYIKDVMKEAGVAEGSYAINQATDKNGNIEHFVVISGGPSGSMLGSTLVIDMKQKQEFNQTDLKATIDYFSKGETSLMQQYNNQNPNNEKEMDILNVKNAHDINNQKLEYNLTPWLLNTGSVSGEIDLSYKKPFVYNSNSTAASLCKASGSSNCNLPKNQSGGGAVIVGLTQFSKLPKRK